VCRPTDCEARKLQRQLPEGALKIVVTGEKKDGRIGGTNCHDLLRRFTVREDGRRHRARQAQEMPTELSAVRKAEAMSRNPTNAGALALKRSGDPNLGSYVDGVPEKLDEL
jgi:hypothetical protein